MFGFLVIILSRYLLIAGGTYLLFYSALGEAIAKRELRLKPPSEQSIRRDIGLSVLSTLIFAIAAAGVMCSYQQKATLLYTDLHQYGLWYLVVSFGLVLLLQDGYFYATHRLLHHPRLFQKLHQGHHRSGDPTPWTSFAFDPLEALIQAVFFIGIVFLIPLHFITMIAVLMTMTVWATLTHLGFELFPASFAHHWLGRWLIGPTHHALHHRHYTVHYGLYFTIWDRLWGTHDPRYEDQFDACLRPLKRAKQEHPCSQKEPVTVEQAVLK